jgi:hypothetical protein
MVFAQSPLCIVLQGKNSCKWTVKNPHSEYVTIVPNSGTYQTHITFFELISFTICHIQGMVRK